jgi:hypothetical protein
MELTTMTLPRDVKKALDELFPDLEKRLTSELSKERRLDGEQLRKGLDLLVESGLLDAAKLLTVGNKIGLVLGAVEIFQRTFGLFPEGKIDGLLGKKTFGRLNQLFKGCTGSLSNQPDLDASSAGRRAAETHEKGKNTNVIFYFVDKTLRDGVKGEVADVDESVADAWQLWQFRCKIKCVQSFFPSDSNVIIDMKSLGGEGGTLGESHVGGPGLTTQLRCTMDLDEDWSNETRFLAALCHEFGHILGLDHSSNPNDLMSPFLKKTANGDILVTKPQENDIKRMQAIWGEAKPPRTEIEIDEGDEDFIRPSDFA